MPVKHRSKLNKVCFRALRTAIQQSDLNQSGTAQTGVSAIPMPDTLD